MYMVLQKYLGFYCISIGGRNIRVVVMNNILPRRVHMHMQYDLKGIHCLVVLIHLLIIN